MKRLTKLCEDTNGGKYMKYTAGDYIGVYPNCTLGDVIDRLAHYEDLEAQGRLVILPAKTVYELTWDAGPNCDLVCPVSIDGEEPCNFCDHGELCIYERECKQEHIPLIGKTVFLSRPEAEAALAASGKE